MLPASAARRASLDPEPDGIPGTAEDARLLDGLERHQGHLGDLLLAQRDLERADGLPLGQGATSGSWRTIWVEILPAEPDGTVTTMGSGRPILMVFCVPFQSAGVAAGWPPSNSLTAS